MLVELQNLAHATLAAVSALALTIETLLEAAHALDQRVPAASAAIVGISAAALALSKAIDSLSFTKLSGQVLGTRMFNVPAAPVTSGGLPPG